MIRAVAMPRPRRPLRDPEGDAPADRRFPRWVYSVGVEPDPRFTLANERTFLASIRTSLALLAAGVALTAVNLPVRPGLRAVAELVLFASGAVLPLAAWLGRCRTERAMRQRRSLPGSLPAAVLAFDVVVVAALLTIGTWTA